ncbi:efflux RND transporter periplasmic adaptor subunit [Parvularcula sp. ZS-1/3]|uniref:Efflux RND transporter periplasmic adaptor subunit n=1 Tax=Parvularcula mediterranea TaxID=2732508 RepID=A0A7Y3W5V6_9PROT|nr:efflux RND transporter periplasmic adaptor subunit [Parvularcula mediterranea]NNU16747.1 efflux RND transporter periplasmic adaptor subunit [Parvularcula mediterranea]
MIRKLVVIGGTLGVLFFFVAAISVMGALRPEPEKQEAEVVAPIAFVRPVEYGPINLKVKTQGEVQPRREIQLAAQIAGRIESVSPSFAGGGVIKQGDVLVTIEDDDYRLAVTRARATVAQSEQRLAVEEAEAALAARDYAELSGNDGTDPSLLALRKPQLAAAEADLASAKANLADAELALKRTRIRAPFDGRVRTINANVGQYVAPGANLGAVFSTDVAEVRLPLTDSDLAKLQLPFAFEAEGTEGPEVMLTADVAGQMRQWKGYLVRVDAAIDSSTRQISAIAEVIDPYGLGSDEGFPMAFGLFVNAEIDGPDVERATTIPLLALQDDNSVFVIDDEDLLQVRRPIIVAQAGEGVIATGGLEEGELLVISPVTVGVGQPIRPLYEGGESASRKPVSTDTGLSAAASTGSQNGAN